MVYWSAIALVSYSLLLLSSRSFYPSAEGIKSVISPAGNVEAKGRRRALVPLDRAGGKAAVARHRSTARAPSIREPEIAKTKSAAGAGRAASRRRTKFPATSAKG